MSKMCNKTKMQILNNNNKTRILFYLADLIINIYFIIVINLNYQISLHT